VTARHRRQTRIAARRDVAEPEIVQALRQAGCAVFFLDHPVDLLVGRGGRNYLLEVKGGGKKKLTEAQVEFWNDWQQRGQVARVETVDDALRAVGLIR
jgi:hypothetical protein